MTSPSPSGPSGWARPVNALTPRRVAWLWPGRLPVGKLSLLEGDPQLGKSLLTLDLCARFSSGRPWPDEAPSAGPAPALVVNGEDSEEDTTLPRLQALGADLDRCFVLNRGDNDAGPPLSIPTRLEALDGALAQTGARLLVIDPLMAFLAPGVNLGSEQSVRRAFEPLAQLVERHHCVALLVRHLNKSGGRRALYRGVGSIGLVANCRSAWLVAADPRAAGRAVLAQVKNNLGAPQPSLAYEIRASDGPGPTVAWLGPTDWTADALLTAAGARPRDPGPAERAEAFLSDALANGPRTVRDLWAQAKSMGLTRRTLGRAKGELNITSIRVWDDGRVTNYWLLPGQVLPAGVAPPDDALEPWLKPLREEFPGPTPLDDL